MIAVGSTRSLIPVDDSTPAVDGLRGLASHKGVAGGYDSATAISGFTRMNAVMSPRVHAKLPSISIHSPFSNAQPGQPLATPLSSTDAPGHRIRPLSWLSTSVPRKISTVFTPSVITRYTSSLVDWLSGSVSVTLYEIHGTSLSHSPTANDPASVGSSGLSGV